MINKVSDINSIFLIICICIWTVIFTDKVPVPYGKGIEGVMS